MFPETGKRFNIRLAHVSGCQYDTIVISKSWIIITKEHNAEENPL